MKYNLIRIAHELTYFLHYYNLENIEINEMNYRDYPFCRSSLMFFDEYTEKHNKWTLNFK